MFGAFTTLYKETDTFPASDTHFNLRVLHVATKLSKIVRSFSISIIRAKIVLYLDVAVYSDVQWMCL